MLTICLYISAGFLNETNILYFVIALFVHMRQGTKCIYCNLTKAQTTLCIRNRRSSKIMKAYWHDINDSISAEIMTWRRANVHFNFENCQTT
jgi:hypothetical protein